MLPFAGGFTAGPDARATGGDTTPRRIAVVGPNADDPHTTLGDWAGASGQAPWLMDGHPREMVTTVLDGLRNHVPADWEVTYSRGADIITLADDPDGAFFPDGQPRPKVAAPTGPDEALIAEADNILGIFAQRDIPQRNRHGMPYIPFVQPMHSIPAATKNIVQKLLLRFHFYFLFYKLNERYENPCIKS